VKGAARAAFKLLARTAAESSLVLLALGSLVFLALRLLPGDPALLVLGEQAAPAEREALRHKLHLDESLPWQYGRFLYGLVTLDFGESLRQPGTPALARVAHALAPTATLAVLTVTLGVAWGVGAALLGAGPWLGARRGRVRGVLDTLAALPLLSFAPLAMYLLAVRARLVPLPADPDAGASGLWFAALLLAVPLGAHTGRTALAALERARSMPFLRVAAAKGLAPAGVWLRHALPTVMGPIVTVVATQIGALLGGAVVVERLFERPGLGLLFLDAYAARDLPVLEACIMTGGVLFVAAQVVGALVLVWVDPRMRATSEAP
jgi:peptide/nickel transport system permease protein